MEAIADRKQIDDLRSWSLKEGYRNYVKKISFNDNDALKKMLKGYKDVRNALARLNKSEEKDFVLGVLADLCADDSKIPDGIRNKMVLKINKR